jgi:hypothetical protein
VGAILHQPPYEPGGSRYRFRALEAEAAVFSHISRPGPQDETNTDEALGPVQAQWPNGRITVGTDLMQITIDAITTTRWPDRSQENDVRNPEALRKAIII